jgi:hypothetical protein
MPSTSKLPVDGASGPKGFVRAPVTAPVGSYVVDHMGDGTILVIRVTRIAGDE